MKILKVVVTIRVPWYEPRNGWSTLFSMRRDTGVGGMPSWMNMSMFAECGVDVDSVRGV